LHSEDGTMNVYLIVGIACLVLWGILLFGLAVPSGWVHVPLAVGFVLVARGLMAPRKR